MRHTRTRASCAGQPTLVGHKRLNLNFHNTHVRIVAVDDHHSLVISAELCLRKTEKSPLAKEWSWHYSTPCLKVQAPIATTLHQGAIFLDGVMVEHKRLVNHA